MFGAFSGMKEEKIMEEYFWLHDSIEKK